MARGQSPRDSGATNSRWLSNPLIHFQTHAKPCLWAAQRPVSDCTAAFMASRGGFIRSNRNIKSAGTQPRLMNVIWRKDQRKTYALILNFVPQTFSFIKKKKCLCSKFGALAPATYLLLSHQKKKPPQKNRGAQLMMWSCWSCQMWCNPKTSVMIKDSACCTTDNVLRWESPLLLEFWNERLGRDCFFCFFYTVSHVKPWWNQGLT